MPDAKAIFLNAVQWEAASELILREEDARAEKCRATDPNAGYRPIMMPACVAAALSMELYLKCLLTLEKVSYPKRHELLLLFNLLTESQRRQMEEAHETIVSAKPIHGSPLRTLLDQITAASDVFLKWRYEHEGTVPDLAFSTHLVRIARDAALRVHPEWSDFVVEHGLDPHAGLIERQYHSVITIRLGTEINDESTAFKMPDARNRADGDDGRPD